MKASPEAQQRLLELADLDTELGRLAHRRRNLPEIAELESLAARAAQVRDSMTLADTELSDLIHVAFGSGLLAVQVGQLGIRKGHRVPDLGRAGG